MLQLPQDVRGSDLGLAVALSLALLVLAARSFTASEAAPEVAPIVLGERAVRVTPIFETVRGGGAAGEPAARELSYAPPADPTAPANPAQEPPSRAKRSAKRTPKRPAEEPAPGATPATDDVTPAPSEEAGSSGPAGVDGADGGAGDGTGEAESGDGDGDRLAAQAIAAYRARLIAWLSRRFTVRGSGLSRDVLRTAKVRAEVDVSESGVVLGYRILEADHPALDRGARDALEAVLGETLPPPPDFYPQALQPRLRITFICTETTCD